jgi:hypothetical protein
MHAVQPPNEIELLTYSLRVITEQFPETRIGSKQAKQWQWLAAASWKQHPQAPICPPKCPHFRVSGRSATSIEPSGSGLAGA